jgi:hypothetical protein
MVHRMHHQDGLPEIAGGLMFLAISGEFCAFGMLHRAPLDLRPAYQVAALVLTFLPLFVILLAVKGMFWVRKRYLIQMEGYAEVKPWGPRKLLTFFLAVLLVGVAFGEVVFHLSHPDRAIVAGGGVLLGAVTALAGKLPRLIADGILIAALGIGLSLCELSLNAGVAIFMGLSGLLFLISGSVALLRLIRQPVEAGE